MSTIISKWDETQYNCSSGYVVNTTTIVLLDVEMSTSNKPLHNCIK